VVGHRMQVLVGVPSRFLSESIETYWRGGLRRSEGSLSILFLSLAIVS